MNTLKDDVVLVTGGSGFVGAHCIVALLQQGYNVRTTIRSISKQDIVLLAVKTGGVSSVQSTRLSFALADLTEDGGWDHAVQGCTLILHVASPFPTQEPQNDDEVIRPAREGTLRVLRAARRANVKRVVLTSSFGAIGYGHAADKQTFDEQDWTNVDGPGVPAYIKSKTLAEGAAWDFVRSAEGQGLELTVVNPPGIFGPVLNNNLSASTLLVKVLLEGGAPIVPQTFGVVDVRDVASLHVLLLNHEHAAGKRFIASTGPSMTLSEVAKLLRAHLPDGSKRVPSFPAQDIVRAPLASNIKARELGWEPRSGRDAILATAESLIRLDLVVG